MSRISELVAKLCPNGVEFTALGDVCEVLNGYAFRSELFNKEGEGLPLIRIRDINTGFSETYYSGEFDDRYVVVDGDVLIGMDGEFRSIRWANGRALLNQRVCRLQRFAPTVLPEFVHYYIRRELTRIHQATQQSTVKHLSSKQLVQARIAVPPLDVQRELVSVLDAFTDLVAKLEANLEAEVDARRRQYEHYRDSLLAFADGSDTRWALFGEVATIVRGGSPRPIQRYLTDAEDGVNWIKIGDVAKGGKYVTSTSEKITPEGARKSRRVEPGDFVLSNSMSFGRPYIVDIDGCIHDGWLAIKDFAEAFVPDFLYHLLRTTRVYKEMAQRAGAGTVQNLNVDIVKGLVLPVPPLAEQKRIAATLDRFDGLVNDLLLSLPAELNARHKQYEYYRDRLLAFPEVA